MSLRAPFARSFVVVFLAALSPLLTGCGGGAGTKGPAKAAVNTLPPANPVAVAKMVQGVKAAADAATRPRAIVLLKEAASIDPNLWEARFDLGVVYATTGDLAAAETELNAARKLAPESSEVVSALAEVQRRRGEEKDAVETLGDFVQSHPDALDLRAQYVAALRGSGQVDKAITEAREVLVRRSGDAAALAELALCHLAKGERDVATLLAKQAVDSNTKSAAGHRAQGLIALDAGDDALAFQSFQKAAQADPKDTTARLNMGAVLLRAGVYPKAEEQFRAILEVVPDDSDAMIGLAAALRGQAEGKNEKKLEEAKTLLEKVLAKDPHMVSANFNLGVLYADFLKKPDLAKPLFERFLDDAHPYHPARQEAERYMKTLANAAPAPPPTPPPAAPAAPAKGKKG